MSKPVNGIFSRNDKYSKEIQQRCSVVSGDAGGLLMERGVCMATYMRRRQTLKHLGAHGYACAAALSLWASVAVPGKEISRPSPRVVMITNFTGMKKDPMLYIYSPVKAPFSVISTRNWASMVHL